MRFDYLSDLPEWDDEFNEEQEEGEDWKSNPTRDACKALYLQWNQVMMMLNGAFDTMKVPDDNAKTDGLPKEYFEDHRAIITGDAYQVAVKIKSSEVGLYTIRMENASIIRKNAQYIYSALLTMMIEKVIEEEYVRAIRSEIDQFRELFKEWVSTFRKDEYIDEWGLFI